MIKEDCIYKSYKTKKVCSCGNTKKIYKCSLAQAIITDRICRLCQKYDNGDKNE